jgi:two-component system chemotaxis response regulator CheY
MAKSILVVDDAAVVRHVVSLTLKKSGYDVVQAVNGKDALEKLGCAKVEMVITDLNMPEMDGLELIRQMRKTEKYRFIPILMLTTVSQEEKRQEGQRAGASAWIFKPFHSTQLLEAVRRYVVLDGSADTGLAALSSNGAQDKDYAV